MAAGYWNQPAKSKEIFNAYLKDTGKGPWLRTGDLGFLENGELFISGRLKDMIIIRGANFAPQDIEWVSQKCHPAVESAESAAFSLTIDGEESLGVVQELNRKDHPSNIDFEEVAAKIRSRFLWSSRFEHTQSHSSGGVQFRRHQAAKYSAERAAPRCWTEVLRHSSC